MCNKYNGWTNRETWVVGLWNDFNDVATELYNDDSENALYNLEKYIKDMIEEFNPLEDTASMYSDLFGGAISKINYNEIAQHYIDDLEG